MAGQDYRRQKMMLTKCHKESKDEGIGNQRKSHDYSNDSIDENNRHSKTNARGLK